MSILFSTYQLIKCIAFVYGGAFNNLSSAFSLLHFLVSIHKKVLKKDICFKLYHSSPRRNEAMHCSSKQSTARYWRHFVSLWQQNVSLITVIHS